MEYVGEPLVSPFTSYNDVKNLSPNRGFDLIFEVDHKNTTKIQLFEDHRVDPVILL